MNIHFKEGFENHKPFEATEIFENQEVSKAFEIFENKEVSTVSKIFENQVVSKASKIFENQEASKASEIEIESFDIQVASENEYHGDIFKKVANVGIDIDLFNI